MSKKQIKYNEAIEELRLILNDLESENVDVDEVTQKVKRAVELIRFCRERIELTEMEVKKVVKEFEQDIKKAEEKD